MLGKESKQTALTLVSNYVLQTQNCFGDSGATNHVTHCMETLTDFEKI